MLFVIIFILRASSTFDLVPVQGIILLVDWGTTDLDAVF